MEDEAEGEGSSPSFRSTLDQLYRLVRLSNYDKQQAKVLIDRIANMGLDQGFSDQQATQILELALRGTTHTGKSITARISFLLLRCIYPAKNYQFGDEFVLTIVGALGPADDVVVDGNTTLADVQDHPSSASESDEDNGNAKTKYRKRTKIAVGVQAAAVRLLVLLLSPPPIASVQLDKMGSNRPDGTHLPISFLSNKARRTLDKYYDVLFHFLDYQTLRPYLCHILSLTTRRKHVRHHRIAKLMALRNSAPDDYYLEALITTCSKYYPVFHLTNTGTQSDRVSTHSGGIRYPDLKWLLLVNSIWSRSDGQGDLNTGSNDRDRRPRKRRKEKRSSLPRNRAGTPFDRLLASNLLPASSVLSIQEGKLLLTEVMTYKGLGYAFERLQLPSHLVCALSHDMLSIAIFAQGTTFPVEDTMSRISHWSISVISEELNLPSSKMIKAHERRPRSEVSHQKTSSMLLLLGEFVGRMGACTVKLQRWTNRLLHVSIWKSLSFEEKGAILNIVESFVPDDWEAFSSDTLDPLKIIASNCNVQESALIIDSMKRLLEKWVIGRNWADITMALDNQDEESFKYQRLSSDVDYIKTITQTISAVVDLSSSLLLRLPYSLEVMNATLGIHEIIFTMPFIGLHEYHLPPRYLLHLVTLTQHGSISTTSRLFGIMKQIFDLHFEIDGEDESMDEDSVLVKESDKIKNIQRSFSGEDARNAFNDSAVYLTDLVWRSNAFGTVPGGRMYDIGPPKEFLNRFSERCDQRGDDLARLYSMTHGATLGLLMEDHINTLILPTKTTVHGPIAPHIMLEAATRGLVDISYHRLRDNHLDWLADRHATGLRDFFHSTVSRFRVGGSQNHGSFREQSFVTDIA